MHRLAAPTVFLSFILMAFLSIGCNSENQAKPSGNTTLQKVSCSEMSQYENLSEHLYDIYAIANQCPMKNPGKLTKGQIDDLIAQGKLPNDGHDAVGIGYVNVNEEYVIPPKYSDAQPFSEGLAVVAEDSIYDGQREEYHYYFINKNGEAITDKFQHALSFSEGLAAVKTNGKWGFIDKSGKMVIPAKFDKATEFKEGVSKALLGSQRDGSWGLIDRLGNWVTKPQFDDIDGLKEGVFRVRLKDRTKSYLTISGKLLVPPQWMSTQLMFRDGIGEFEDKQGKRHYVDKQGVITDAPKSRELSVLANCKESPLTLDQAMALGKSEEVLQVWPNGRKSVYYGRRGRNYQKAENKLIHRQCLYGYKDSVGKMTIKPQFAKAEPFEGDVARVYVKDAGGENLQAAIINKSGNFIVKPGIYASIGKFSEGIAKIKPLGSNDIGYINQTGKVIVEPQYPEADDFSEGLAKVTILTDPKEREIQKKLKSGGIPFDFTGRKMMSSVRIGYINKSGQMAIEPQFSSIMPLEEGQRPVYGFHGPVQRAMIGNQRVKHGAKVVYFDKAGRILHTQPRSLKWYRFSEGLAVVRYTNWNSYLENPIQDALLLKNK